MTVTELAKKYPAASEYISQIYLIIRDYSYCNNRRLAEHLAVSPSAVSQTIGRLKRLELAEQDAYGMIMLSPIGRETAEAILRRHYLLEYLMVKKLSFPWELADKEAEQLQDKVSEAFIDHLELELGHPLTCPHGNPFPSNPDAVSILSAPPLTTVKAENQIEIVRITEEGERVDGLLHACFEGGIVPGSLYRVQTKSEDEIMLYAETAEKFIPLPSAFARHIRIRVHA